MAFCGLPRLELSQIWPGSWLGTKNWTVEAGLQFTTKTLTPGLLSTFWQVPSGILISVRLSYNFEVLTYFLETCGTQVALSVLCIFFNDLRRCLAPKDVRVVKIVSKTPKASGPPQLLLPPQNNPLPNNPSMGNEYGDEQYMEFYGGYHSTPKSVLPISH